MVVSGETEFGPGRIWPDLVSKCGPTQFSPTEFGPSECVPSKFGPVLSLSRLRSCCVEGGLGEGGFGRRVVWGDGDAGEGAPGKGGSGERSLEEVVWGHTRLRPKLGCGQTSSGPNSVWANLGHSPFLRGRFLPL